MNDHEIIHNGCMRARRPTKDCQWAQTHHDYGDGLPLVTVPLRRHCACVHISYVSLHGTAELPLEYASLRRDGGRNREQRAKRPSPTLVAASHGQARPNSNQYLAWLSRASNVSTSNFRSPSRSRLATH